jgi:dihydrofolate reductase
MALASVELVVAVSENDVIGRDNQLPWRLPADLRHFKSLTLGQTVLMGRKTYESIGKALPDRTNLVLSRSPAFAPADAKVVSDLGEAQSLAESGCALMVIGGAEIYRLCLPLARRIHLTLVHAIIPDGDAFFAAWRGSEWCQTHMERFEPDEKNSLPYSFVTLDKAASGVS